MEDWIHNLLQQFNPKRKLSKLSSTLRELPSIDEHSWKRTVLPTVVSELPVHAPIAVYGERKTERKAWELKAPCTVRLRGRPGGVDVHLQLFSLRVGEPMDFSYSTKVKREQSLTNDINKDSLGLVNALDRSAGLSMAHLLFPDTTRPLLHVAAGAWYALSALRVTHNAMVTLHRKKRNNSDEQGVFDSKVMKWLGSVIQKYGEPAGMLAIASILWATAHPTSHQMGECIATLLPVLAGYNKTAKEARNHPDPESVWHDRHKWAARRTAHLLTKLPADDPPLGRVMDVWEGMNVNVNSAVGTGSILSCWTAGADVWGTSFWGSILIRESRKETTHSELGTAAAAAAARVESSRRDRLHIMDSPSDWSSSPKHSMHSLTLRQDSGPQLAALFGQGDHGSMDHDEHALTSRDITRLAFRAVQLVMLFAPFLLLGVFLLLVSSALAEKQRQLQACMRLIAFKCLLWSCRSSGAAFIKWGQWSSTREDIFPEDFCRVLSELHDKAPIHSFHRTRTIVEEVLGLKLEDIFEWVEPTALASGSIAQVHKAGLRVAANGKLLPPHCHVPGSQVLTVVIKVRHPGVSQRIWDDFQLLRPLAALTGHIKSLKGLGLKDTVSQFSHTMTAQADLRVEAAHLARFYSNFEKLSASVVVPRPFDELTRESVLVETFEPGKSVTKYIQAPHSCNTKIVAVGVDTYLKMLLQDNFVHTDLHPGNILVRPVSQQTKMGEDDMDMDGAIQLILLDFGLAEELTPRIRRHFIGFLNAISAGDGGVAAQHLLNWSTKQECPDTLALKEDVKLLFAKKCNIHSKDGINLDDVMKSVLHLARKHEVSIDSGYAALVVGICVIVGFATGLDPRVNLMDAATPCMLYYNLTGRVSGRLYV